MTADAEVLASSLDEARTSASAIDGSQPPWSGLDEELASRVGAALLRRIGAEGSPFWKLGAVDRATQDRLGVQGPLVAPLDPSSVWLDVSEVTCDTRTLIRPRFEPEIGLALVGEEILAVPCVEIADSRFSAWALPPWGVVADALLQGRMVFGLPVPAPDRVVVTVTHDGRTVTTGEGAWSEAVARLDLLPSGLARTRVATGALTELHDCEPGLWEFDFGDLGHIAVRVR